MIKITCASCGKPLHLDKNKLPMKEVKFACPHCKATLAYDRRAHEAPPPPPPGLAPESVFTASPEGESYGRSTALIVGGEIPGLSEEIKALGFSVHRCAGAEEARELYFQEFPQMVALVPAQLSMPPLQEMAPITGLLPKERRRCFFVLVADGLRTMDGNTAFLYQVDAVVAAKDIGSFHRTYKDAFQFYRKLYQHFRSYQEGDE